MFEALEGDLGNVALLGVNDAGDHVAYAQQHAREYSGGEQLADVQTGGVGVDYHDYARWYDGAYAGGRDHDGRGPAVLVASLLEGAQADGAERGGIGIGGAGDACHEYACQLDSAGQAPTHPSNHRVCEVNDGLRYTCSLHDLAGEHEEGDGDE